MQTQTDQASYEIAIQQYNKAIKELPTFAQAYNYRGLLMGIQARLTAPLRTLTRRYNSKKTMLKPIAIAVVLIASKVTMIAPSKIVIQQYDWIPVCQRHTTIAG